jgi:hypothetical protein
MSLGVKLETEGAGQLLRVGGCQFPIESEAGPGDVPGPAYALNYDWLGNWLLALATASLPLHL